MNRILWVWDCAGLSTLYQRNLFPEFHGEILITRKWNINKISNGTEFSNKIMFGINSILKAKNHDLIHVSYHDIMLMGIRAFYINKPMIMHFHGSDIRGLWEKKKEIVERNADKILVSTPDLLEDAPDNVEFLPNIVDETLFKEIDIPRNNRAIHFDYNRVNEALRLAEIHDLDLRIMNDKNIQHRNLPDILKNFEYLIEAKDVLGHKIIFNSGTHSKLGLEALHMGLKVVKSDGSIFHRFPHKHLTESVIPRLKEIYLELLG
jgi:hypothetical protein